MATGTTTDGIGYGQGAALKAPAWHGLVVWDMLLNGLTTGLFLVAALCELALPRTFAPVARSAYPVALVFLAADLLLLTLDLGDSWRFHHMLRVFKPGSPMSVGVWSLTFYSLPLTIAAALSLFAGGEVVEGVRLAAVVVGIVPALASAVYKGVLLSTTAQHGWKDARWLGAALTSGAVVLGCAEMIVLAYMVGQADAAEVLRTALGVLVIAHAVPLFLVANALWPAAGSRQRWLAFAAVAIGSMLAPLCLLVAVPAPAGPLLAAVVVLVGSLANRAVLVQRPHVAA